MYGRLTLSLSPGTSALERILSVVRRRGFTVDDLQAAQRGEPDQLAVELTVSGERSVDILSRHLANLADCRLVAATAGAALELPRRSRA